MKNHAADSKIRSRLKIGFRADGTRESHPTAWELNETYHIANIFSSTSLIVIFYQGVMYQFVFRRPAIEEAPLT